MEKTSIEILTNLPGYSDDQLDTLWGQMAMECYGRQVTLEVGHYVLTEKNRRKEIEQDSKSYDAIDPDEQVDNYYS
tara:strand:- start:536 stop:763 length:228 start_codon:yes stop_codon:yes gene_type:complete